MKSGYSILTRRMQGMDVRVWLTMLALMFVSAIGLAFKLTADEACKLFKIGVTDYFGSGNNSFYQGEDISFSVKEPGTVSWDFGDNFRAEGAKVKHKFVNDGRYTVTAMLNGRCVQTTTVTIKKVVVDKSGLDEDDPIWAPKTITVGKKAAFAYNGPRKITSFEWSIVDSRIYPVQNTKIISYNFIAPGEQTIRLKLNDGKQRTYDKQITVLPEDKPISSPKAHAVAIPHFPSKKPGAGQEPQQVVDEKPAPPPVEEKKKSAAEISDVDLRSIFEGIAKGKRDAQDVYKYLCNGGATRVIAKGKDETVSGICAILAKKGSTIKSFSVLRDPNNCITIITLDYKNKFLGVF